MSFRTAFEVVLIVIILIQNGQRLAEWTGEFILWIGRRFFGVR